MRISTGELSGRGRNVTSMSPYRRQLSIQDDIHVHTSVTAGGQQAYRQTILFLFIPVPAGSPRHHPGQNAPHPGTKPPGTPPGNNSGYLGTAKHQTPHRQRETPVAQLPPSNYSSYIFPIVQTKAYGIKKKSVLS